MTGSFIVSSFIPSSLAIGHFNVFFRLLIISSLLISSFSSLLDLLKIDCLSNSVSFWAKFTLSLIILSLISLSFFDVLGFIFGLFFLFFSSSFSSFCFFRYFCIFSFCLGVKSSFEEENERIRILLIIIVNLFN